MACRSTILRKNEIVFDLKFYIGYQDFSKPVLIIWLIFSLKMNFNLGYSNLHVFSTLQLDYLTQLFSIDFTRLNFRLDYLTQLLTSLVWIFDLITRLNYWLCSFELSTWLLILNLVLQKYKLVYRSRACMGVRRFQQNPSWLPGVQIW